MKTNRNSEIIFTIWKYFPCIKRMGSLEMQMQLIVIRIENGTAYVVSNRKSMPPKRRTYKPPPSSHIQLFRNVFLRRRYFPTTSLCALFFFTYIHILPTKSNFNLKANIPFYYILL